jgi:hypothetical protein
VSSWLVLLVLLMTLLMHDAEVSRRCEEPPRGTIKDFPLSNERQEIAGIIFVDLFLERKKSVQVWSRINDRLRLVIFRCLPHMDFTY